MHSIALPAHEQKGSAACTLQETANHIQIATDLLVGDVFLSAACIAYYGAFTGGPERRNSHVPAGLGL
jgi:hypothetical protein